MSNPPPPIPPFTGDDTEDVPTRIVDGKEVPDPDADDAQVDSAEADRLAAEADDDAG